MNVWRMGVLRCVRVTVVITMVSRPPQRSSLPRRITKHRADKLKPTTGAKRSVRKVAMVKRGQTEYATEECERRYPDRYPADTNPKHRQASNM